MKYVQFDYVNKFSCLAGKCPDTCCKDWQIILDEDAIARYASLPGELGERVRAAMLTESRAPAEVLPPPGRRRRASAPPSGRIPQ